jgi:hypothetical protein
MRTLSMCALSVIAVACLDLCSTCRSQAAEYRVEFATNGTGGQTVSLVHGEIDNWQAWHTINDPQGVNIFNGSGAQIKAVWIKCNNTAADRFAVACDAGHDLFPTVWRSADNTEVLFLDGNNFTSLDTVWNRVNDTSGATGTTGEIFTGRLYTQNPPVPSGWVQVSPCPPTHRKAGPSSPWPDIVRRLPPKLRSISTYAVDESEGTIVVLSRNVPFAYRLASKELRPVLIPVPYRNGVNRLTLHKNSLELWKNGDLVARSDLAQEGTLGPRLAGAMLGSTAHALDGVKGTVVRPKQVDAKVQGCSIAEQKHYSVKVGDVIELDYTYPIVPEAMPQKVSVKQTSGSAVELSPIGVRMIEVPMMVGASTIGFFLEAKQAGDATVTLVIDDNRYEYAFTVK